MKTDWLEQDRQIGEWLDKHGVENYEQCPIIRRTMLYGGSAENNEDWQENHLWAFEGLGFAPANVIEIGAGTGQFAKLYCESSDGRPNYIIYDLPNITRVQKDECRGLADVSWLAAPCQIFDAVIVSLFAISEMPYDERDRLLDGFGRHNAMFFAFQEKHEDMLNWDWFVRLGKSLRRDFAIAPCEVDRCWYMYVEAE